MSLSSQSCRVKLDEGAQSCTCMGMRGKQLCFVSFHTAFHQHGAIEFGKSEVKISLILSSESWLGLDTAVNHVECSVLVH